MYTDVDAVACPAVWRGYPPRADDRGFFGALVGRKLMRAARHPLSARAPAAFRFRRRRKSARNRRREVTPHHTQPVG